MTLSFGLVIIGMGILGTYGILTVFTFLRFLISLIRKLNKAHDPGLQAIKQAPLKRDESPHGIGRTSPQPESGVYSHALRLFDRGLSVHQVRKKIDIPKGEMELLIRMQEMRSS